jgi:hypothetical protein
VSAGRARKGYGVEWMKQIVSTLDTYGVCVCMRAFVCACVCAIACVSACMCCSSRFEARYDACSTQTITGYFFLKKALRIFGCLKQFGCPKPKP